jgi:hypothetical protein
MTSVMYLFHYLAPTILLEEAQLPCCLSFQQLVRRDRWVIVSSVCTAHASTLLGWGWCKLGENTKRVQGHPANHSIPYCSQQLPDIETA